MPTLMVRTSERQSFLTCRQRWEWGWVEKLKTPDEDVKLIFGDFAHQALAIYYKPGKRRGTKPAETFEKLATKRLKDRKEAIWAGDDYVDLIDLGVGMLERYVEHWKHADSEYKVISSEQNFQVPIGYIEGYRVIYVGTIDGVWLHLPTNKLRFAEHKTATAISRDALPMDEQVGAYWTYGPRWLRLKGILKSGDKLDGVLYNWLRKAIPNPDDNYDNLGRKLNKDGSISKKQPAAYFDRQLTFRGDIEAQRVKERVRQQIRDMIAARNDRSLIYKNPGPQFMPNCKFCGFKDMCELHETGNDWIPFKESAFVVWEPYSAHERVERR